MSHCLKYLLIVLNLMTVIRSDVRLGIFPNQSILNEPSHQHLVLTCGSVSGQQPFHFSQLKWFNPRNEEITTQYTRDINRDIRTELIEFSKQLLLHFSKPTPNDSGLYKCTALFQHSDSLEAKIHINFYEDVQWIDCPLIQSLIKGRVGERIRCKASANPKPLISWTKEDVNLDLNKRFTIDSNGIQVNEEVDESDGGLFRIRALVTETGRLHEQYITVQVLVKPQITSFADHFEGVEGESKTIKCEANGNPEPIYWWFDPNKRNLSSVFGYSVDKNSGTLIINKIHKLEDSGIFTCIAENSAGKDEKSSEFVVIRRPIINSFENKSYDQSKQSILECRATGDPKPELSIRKDGNSRPFVIGLYSLLIN
jgi:neural cell adhesion molecule